MRKFRTLRGFLEGDEPDEEIRFAFSATVRVFGDIPHLERITERLGLQPTHFHRKGESRGEEASPWPHDMWAFSPDLPESEPLERHIESLWLALKPHKEYLLELKRAAKVDVFLGYRSNTDHAGIEIPHTSLEMFRELEVPFGLSIIVA